MSAPVILLLAQKGLLRGTPRKTRNWIILTPFSGGWAVQSEHNYKPSVPDGCRLVREYR